MVSPTLRIPHFGFGVIVDESVALYNKNRTLPNIQIGWQSTRVLQSAFAFSVLANKHARRLRPELHIGVGAKIAWRKGGLRKLEQSELLTLTSGDTSNIKSLMGSMRMGFGFDFGSLFVLPLSKKLRFQFGAAWTNIGDITFKFDEPAAMKGNASLGVAVIYKSGLFGMKASYEHSNLLQSLDWRLKNHAGFEIGLPILKIYGGLNQVYFTYGAELDLYFFKLTGASYVENLSRFAHQDQNQRYLLKLDFVFHI